MLPAPRPHYFDIRDFGAIGDGIADDGKAFASAIQAIRSNGGGTLVLPPGNYLSGSIEFVSNMELHLEPGSAILGIEEESAYPVIERRWEGKTQAAHAPLLWGRGLENVSITGRGRIDGRGSFWWDRFRQGKLEHPRPTLVSFIDCDNLILESFTAMNSPSWHINPVRCVNVRIAGITVKSPKDSPNTDGINPDSCRAVRISDCLISVGDDCITIKAGNEDETERFRAPCEDICVVNCVLESGHGGVVIGSEMSGGVRGVVISNCAFNGTDRGIRLKSRRGRGGTIEDILVSNVIMRDVLCPVTMNLFYGCNGGWGNEEIMDKSPRPIGLGTPAIRNIHFDRIVASRCGIAAGFLYGLPEMPLENIRFSDCDISMSEESKVAAQAEMGDGFPDLCRAGFFLRNISGASFRSVRVRNQNGLEFDSDDSVNARFLH